MIGLFAAEVVFFASLAVIGYVYVGYPTLIHLLSALFGRPFRGSNFTPKVSIVITARNEERDIARKIENSLALDYPRHLLEVIVASDCSTDRTDRIVRSFAPRGVILHRQWIRFGKTAAQNFAARQSSGDILVFSDATTMLSPDAVTKIVRHFADPGVGCVGGQLIYEDPSSTGVGSGCRSYWSLETQIRKSESRLGSLIGVSGCLYAVRRSCHRRIAADMIDDFVVAIEVHLQGLRTVFDPEAVAIEQTNRVLTQEFRMRVRVIEQTMRALHRYWPLLTCRRTMFTFQLISHKVLRYAAPLFFISAYISNLLLLGKGQLFSITFLAMSLFYLSASLGWVLDRLKWPAGPFAIPYYFVLANVASIVAFVKFLRGESRVVWEPARDPIARIQS